MFKALFLALTLAAGWTTVSNQETAATETSSSLPLLSIGAPEALQDPEVTQASSPKPLRLRKIERLPNARERTAPKPRKPPVAQAPAKMRVVLTSTETQSISRDERQALLGEIQRLQEENSRLQGNLQGKSQRRQVQDQKENLRGSEGAIRPSARRNSAREVELTKQREVRIVKEAERVVKAQKRALAERERVLIGAHRNLSELNRAEHVLHTEKAHGASIEVHKRHTNGAARAAERQIEFEIAVRAAHEAERQQDEAHKGALIEILHSGSDLRHERLREDTGHVEHVIHGIAEGHEPAIHETYRVQLHELLGNIELGHGGLQEDLEALQEQLEGLMEHLESNNDSILEGLEHKHEGLEELHEHQGKAYEELVIHLDEASSEGNFRVQLTNGLDQLVDHKDLSKLVELNNLKGLAMLDRLAELGDIAELQDLQGFVELSEGGNVVVLRGLNHFFEKDEECSEVDKDGCDDGEPCCGEEGDNDCCDDDDSECKVQILSSAPMIGRHFEGNGQSNTTGVETNEDGHHVIIYSCDSEETTHVVNGQILNQVGITVDGSVTVLPEISKDDPQKKELWFHGSVDSTSGTHGVDTFHYLDSNGKTINVSGDNSLPTVKRFGLTTKGTLPQPIRWRTSVSTDGQADIWTTKAPTDADCPHCKGTCGTAVINIQNQGGKVYIDTHECKTTDVSTDKAPHFFPCASAPSAPARIFFSGQTPPSPVCPPATCDPKADLKCADTPTRDDDGVSMHDYPNTSAPAISTFQVPVYEASPEAVRDYTFASQNRSEDTTVIELERMLMDVLREVDALQAEVDRVRVRVNKTQSR